MFRSIKDNPLAFCHPRTVSKPDFLDVDIITPLGVFEESHLKFNSTQRWYWLSNQSPDEIAVFIQFDSHQDEEEIRGKRILDRYN